MAITIKKSDNLLNSEWNEEAEFINMKMADADTEQSDDDALVKGLFTVKTSKRFGEKVVGSSAFSSFKTVAEGGSFETDTMQDVNEKLIKHISFGKEYSITPEMKEDNLHDITGRAAKNLVRAFKRTRPEFATAALTASIASDAKVFSYGGTASIDCSTPDGLSLFNAAHTGMTGVATQSNVFTNAFGDDDVMLDRLANIGFNFVNASGQHMGYVFDTLIVPGNCHRLIRLAKKIINSDQQVGNDFNDANINKGMWKLIVDPYWQAAASTEPYIIMSSKANKDIEGSLFYDRLGLSVEEDLDIHTHGMIFSGRGRLGVGFSDWRHIILGGSTQTGATTLK